MPFGNEPITMLSEVVDLAIEDDLHPSVFIGHGLTPLGPKIDDGQATMAEGNPRSQIGSLVVRTTMSERVAHTLDNPRIEVLRWIGTDYSANPTHRYLPRSAHAIWVAVRPDTVSLPSSSSS